MESTTLGITVDHAQLIGMNIHDTDPTVSAQWVLVWNLDKILGIMVDHAWLIGMNIYDTDPTVSAQWVLEVVMRRQLSRLSHYLVKD